MIPHMKAKVIFIDKKNLLKPNTKEQNKKMPFSSSTNIQFTIREQFLQLKAFKSVEIDAIGVLKGGSIDKISALRMVSSESWEKLYPN